jgi:hypothetical protein
MLAAVMRVRRGIKRKGGAIIDGDLIEGYLRVAYPVAEFRECALGRQIRAWELRNDPYTILA